MATVSSWPSTARCVWQSPARRLSDATPRKTSPRPLREVPVLLPFINKVQLQFPIPESKVECTGWLACHCTGRSLGTNETTSLRGTTARIASGGKFQIKSVALTICPGNSLLHECAHDRVDCRQRIVVTLPVDGRIKIRAGETAVCEAGKTVTRRIGVPRLKTGIGEGLLPHRKHQTPGRCRSRVAGHGPLLDKRASGEHRDEALQVERACRIDLPRLPESAVRPSSWVRASVSGMSNMADPEVRLSDRPVHRCRALREQLTHLREMLVANQVIGCDGRFPVRGRRPHAKVPAHGREIRF